MRWIIGDIHGMLRPLEALLDAVRRRDADARLVFLGDYVDRGPDSAGVIDRLLRLADEGVDARFVRGNHDDAFDLVLHAACYCHHPDLGNPTAMFAAMAQAGMQETFISYGVDAIDVMDVARWPTPPRLAELAAAVPERHKAFIRDLSPVVEDDDFFAAHAWWSPSYPDEFSRLAFNPGLRHELLWGRFGRPDIIAAKRWGRTGYFGHTPTTHYGPGRGAFTPARLIDESLRPVVGPSVVLLDTAAAVLDDGRLTAWCHDTGQYVQVHRDGSILSDAMPPSNRLGG